MGVKAAVYCDRMKVPSCLLANNAAVNEKALLDVVGGGWEHFSVERFPASITGWLAGLFELEPVERGTDQIVRMAVTDRDDNDLGASATFIVNETSRLVPFAIQFNCVAGDAGMIKVVLSTDDEVIRSTEFEVRLNGA